MIVGKNKYSKLKLNVMNKLVRNLIKECKQKQEVKEKYKANTIEFDNYFK